MFNVLYSLEVDAVTAASASTLACFFLCFTHQAVVFCQSLSYHNPSRVFCRLRFGNIGGDLWRLHLWLLHLWLLHLHLSHPIYKEKSPPVALRFLHRFHELAPWVNLK